MKTTIKHYREQLRRARMPVLPTIVLATLAACELPSDHAAAGMQDLQHWLASVRPPLKALPALPPKLNQQTPASAAFKPLSGRRDPFAPLTPASDNTLSHQLPNPSNPVRLRLLGTVRDNGVSYALIGADQQVLCVPSHAPLPSYPIRVAAVSDHAVELEHRRADGSLRRSTLRLGQ